MDALLTKEGPKFPLAPHKKTAQADPGEARKEPIL